MRSRRSMHAGGTYCIAEILREGQPSFARIAAAHEESRRACTLALQDALQTSCAHDGGRDARPREE